MNRLQFLRLFLLLFVVACSGEQQPQNANNEKASGPIHKGEPVEVTILQLNDVYEISPVDNGQYGGMARVAGLRKELLKENPNTLTVLAGDFLSPSLTGTLKDENGDRINGRHMVEAMNATGVDLVTFGNHEFDLSSLEELQKRINESEFDWTTANVFHQIPNGLIPFAKEIDGITHNFSYFDQRTFKSPSGQEMKLGIIGVTLEFNVRDYTNYSLINPAFMSRLEIAKKECDLVLGLTHLNIEQDQALAAEVPEVPLLMGGHDHDNMKVMVGKTAITKADANAKTVYVHRIKWYPESKSHEINSELVEINAQTPEDAEVAAIVKKWEDLADKSMIDLGYQPDEVLTTVTEPLDGRESEIRNHQTNLGDVITAAMLKVRPQAEVALFNSGSVRCDDVLDNDITQYDILRTFPYGGGIVDMDLKGSILIQTLEVGTTTNVGKGGFLQVANVSKEDDTWMMKGEVIDVSKIYKVTMPEFLAEGLEANLDFLSKETFTVPKAIEPADLRNDIRDIVMAYLREL